MLTHDDFLALTDFKLLLGRNFIVAARATVAVYRNNGQPVFIGASQPTIDPHQPFFYISFRFVGLLGQLIFFLLGFTGDGVQFALFNFKVLLCRFQRFQRAFVTFRLIFDFKLKFPDFLLAHLDIQPLYFYLFGDGVVLAVIFYLIELAFVFLYRRLRILYHVAAVNNGIFLFIQFTPDFLYTGLQPSDIVFQVAYFHRQFATYLPDFIDFGMDGLQQPKRPQFLFYSLFHLTIIFYWVRVHSCQTDCKGRKFFLNNFQQ